MDQARPNMRHKVDKELAVNTKNLPFTSTSTGRYEISRDAPALWRTDFNKPSRENNARISSSVPSHLFPLYLLLQSAHFYSQENFQQSSVRQYHNSTNSSVLVFSHTFPIDRVPLGNPPVIPRFSDSYWTSQHVPLSSVPSAGRILPWYPSL